MVLRGKGWAGLVGLEVGVGLGFLFFKMLIEHVFLNLGGITVKWGGEDIWGFSSGEYLIYLVGGYLVFIRINPSCQTDPKPEARNQRNA